MGNNQTEDTEFSGLLEGVTFCLSMYSFIENSTADILAGLHIGQHILDFGKGGGVLIGSLSDLAISVGSRVIPSC